MAEKTYNEQKLKNNEEAKPYDINEQKRFSKNSLVQFLFLVQIIGGTIATRGARVYEEK